MTKLELAIRAALAGASLSYSPEDLAELDQFLAGYMHCASQNTKVTPVVDDVLSDYGYLLTVVNERELFRRVTPTDIDAEAHLDEGGVYFLLHSHTSAEVRRLFRPVDITDGQLVDLEELAVYNEI